MNRRFPNIESSNRLQQMKLIVARTFSAKLVLLDQVAEVDKTEKSKVQLEVDKIEKKIIKSTT